MRIRRCASRLLGSSASAPALPLFELTPPSPPPPHEPHAAGFVAAPATSSSSPAEPCVLSLSPWDLMDQLHLSDPQDEKIFLETYSVAVAWRASWLFQPSMPAAGAGSIKEEDMAAVDVVDGVIFELRVASRKRARKKYGSKPKKGEAKEEAEGSDAAGGGGGGSRVWTCKKKNGKGWFCRRPVSLPDSLCPYHSDEKPRKRAAAFAGEGCYYYPGFGPSRSKRHRVSGSTSGGGGVPEPSPAGQKEEAPPDDPKEHIGVATGQAKAGGAEHKAAPLAHVDNRTSWEKGMAGIAGCDEERSDDLYVAESRDIKRKSPSLKKRWRKPVKARSLKSLM